jgi:hypothetical protein
VWTHHFYNEVDEPAVGSAVIVDAAGIVNAAGFLGLPIETDDAWLHTLGSDGTPLWEARYDGAAGFGDWFFDVARTTSGIVVAVGHETTERVLSGKAPSSEVDVVILAYAPDGERLWRQALEPLDDHGLFQSPPALAISGTDRIVVGANAATDGGFPQMFFAEIALDGALVDRWMHVDDAYRGLELVDLAFDDQGGMHAVASGTPDDAGDDHEWLGRWDAEGVYLGAVADVHEGARAVAVVTREGGTIVLGGIYTNATAPVALRPFVHRYDAARQPLWTRTLELDAGDGSVEPRALAIDCAGRTLVLAMQEEIPWIIRLDDAGDEIDRLQPIADDLWSFRAMAADPAGNPVIVGRGWDAMLGGSFVVRKIAG